MQRVYKVLSNTSIEDIEKVIKNTMKHYPDDIYIFLKKQPDEILMSLKGLADESTE